MRSKENKILKVVLINLILVLMAVIAIGAILLYKKTKINAYEGYLQAAEDYVFEGEYEEAVEQLESAIKLNAKEISGYLLLSEVYTENGEYEEAIEVLEAAYDKTDSSKVKKELKKVKEEAEEAEEKEKTTSEGKGADEKDDGEMTEEETESIFHDSDKENEERAREEAAQEIPTEESADTEAMNAYQEFLDGSRPVYIPSEYVVYEEYVDGNHMAYMTDMLRMIKEEYLEWSERQKIANIQYSYIDCGKDGIPELIIQFIGLDIYSQGDTSDLQCIINYQNGQLVFCYEVASWARSAEEIYYYGYAESSGSGGAGCHIFESRIIDRDGVCQNIYEMENLMGWWTNSVNPEAYEQCFTTEQEPVLVVDVYTIGDRKYHTYEIDYDYETECNNYIAMCQAAGNVFCSEEEVNQAISERIELLGISAECMEKKEIEWQILENPLYAEYVAE